MSGSAWACVKGASHGSLAVVCMGAASAASEPLMHAHALPHNLDAERRIITAIPPARVTSEHPADTPAPSQAEASPSYSRAHAHLLAQFPPAPLDLGTAF
jgi:hypothetical protein